MNEELLNMPDERTALGMLLTQQPRLELRVLEFPVRTIVLAVIFGESGEVTVPITPDSARKFASNLLELVGELEAGGNGSQN
jgi:hypothetical protein